MSSLGQSAGNVRAKGSSFCRCCSSASVIAGSLSLRRKRIAWSRYDRATAWCFFQCAQPSGRSTPLRVFGIASSFAAPPATWRRRMPCISCRQSWISALNVCALSKTYSPEPAESSSSPRRTAARNAPTTFFSVAAFSERSSSFPPAATIAPVTASRRRRPTTTPAAPPRRRRRRRRQPLRTTSSYSISMDTRTPERSTTRSNDTPFFALLRRRAHVDHDRRRALARRHAVSVAARAPRLPWRAARGPTDNAATMTPRSIPTTSSSWRGHLPRPSRR